MDKITKASSLVMIKKINSVDTFDLICKTQLIGLKNEISANVIGSAFDKYLLVKCQRARIWLGIVRVISAIDSYQSIKDGLGSTEINFNKVYHQEYLGLPIENLFYYNVEIVLKSYVPMQQSE